MRGGGEIDWCGSPIAGCNDRMSDKESVGPAFRLHQNTFYPRPSEIQKENKMFAKIKCIEFLKSSWFQFELYYYTYYEILSKVTLICNINM